MAEYIPAILLWLFVINHGIAFGAGLYEQRIIWPQWFSRSDSGIRVNSAAMWSTDTGRKFWLPVTTVPLTLLTLASLAAAWQSQSPRYQWWLGAAVITLLERIGTLSYIIPTALQLMREREDALPAAKAGVMASQWMALNRVRATLALIAWLAALRALSLP